MKPDLGLLLTIFLAIVLARIVEQALFGVRVVPTSTTQMNEATPKVVYANPIQEYIATHHPNASGA